jgi:hypothetical protein
MEHLESRLLLSTCATPTVIDLGAVVQADASSLTAPFTPSEIRQAYGVNEISFNGTAGDGSGQTIAIVDAYNDPNIISDANTFSANYGLPQFNASGGPTLQVLNQFGGATLPSNASPGTWDVEESLDVEWAHAMAPNANIILFEANSNGTNSLYRAVTTAAGYSGVSVVSMSWHSNNAEFSGETSLDSTFTTPSGHQGVTFLASSGDVGGLAIYPSVSPNVIAVGGTSLTLNGDGSYGSESAWSDGGGGISKYESQPSYQNGKVNGDSSTNRTVPDVSMVADPNTGVFLLDTFYSSQYQQAGGTSLSAPLWAGLIAVADQGLALKGISSLNGATQTLPDLYSLPSTDFHDITTGSNGNPATVGYDMATGLGSPIANLLVPALAGYSTASTASELVFTQEPGSVTAGNAINPSVVVKIEDQNGNVLSGDSSNVTLTVNSGPGSLDGTTVTVQAQNGVATFSNLTLDAAGGYTLKASDTSDGLSNFVSNSFTVSPAAATQLVFSTQPINGVAGVAISSVVLSIEDQFGNVESGDGSSVSIAASGPGALTGTSTTSVTAVKGVATFSNLTLDTAGSYTLKASDTADSLTSAASNSFTISPAAASQLVFSTQPINGTAGVALSSVVLSIEDQFGNVESGDGSSVSIAASGPGALTGTSTTSVTAVKGVATFSNLTLDTAGGYTLKASDTSDGLSNFASNSFTVSSAAASKMVFTTQPINGTAGAALSSVVLSIEDQFGNVESGDGSSVSIAASGPGALTGTSTTSVTAVKGVATFSNLTLDTAGSYTLKASDTTDSLTSAASNSFTISPAAATQLVFSTQPIGGTAGVAISSVVLSIEDQFGNVESGDSSSVSVAASGPAALTGTSTTSVHAVKGVVTFSNLTLDAAGGYTLKASDTTDNLTSAASNSFTISPAAASQIVLTTQPINGTAGMALSSVVLSIEDQFGNVESGDGSSVSIAASGPGALTGTSTTSVTAVKGVATFSNLTLDTAGGYTLKASDTTDSLTSAASNSFTISPATATQLVFSTQPSDGIAGVALSPVVLSIEDQFGNVESGDGSSVSISASGPGALTGTSTTSVTAVKGVATFSNLTLDTAGGYTLQASDATDGLTSAASSSFTIAAASSDKLVFTQEPGSVAAGNAITPSVVVKIEDQNGNVLSGDDSNVTLTVNSGPGSLTGTTVTVQAQSGVAAFSNLTLDTAGGYTLKASDTSDGLSGFVSNSFTVSPAAATQLVFSTQPSDGTAGVAISSVVLSIEDQFGNVESGDGSSVSIAASGPGALTGTSTTSVTAVKGVATFSNLTLDTAGGYTLKASDTTDSLTSAASNSFTISSAAATQLVFSTQPSDGTAGVALSPVVLSIEDQFGNVESGDGSSVSISASGPGALTGTSTTSVTAVKGVATFSNLTLDTAGGYTLQASDTTDGLTSAASSSFTIAAASSDKLVFTQEPGSVAAGNAITPSVVVKIEDQNGNVLSGDDSNVTLTVNSGPGSLTGTTVTVQAQSGVAAFSNLTLDTAGGYTLKASDTSDGLSGFVSNSFTVSPAAATQLVFSTQPSDGTAGVAISSVVLSIEDQFGNVESGDGSSVSIAASGPASLSTSANAVKGVATFSNLTLDTAGGYTLTASDTADSLTSAASNSFTISPAAATQLVFTTQPTDGTAGVALSSVVLSIEDQFGNMESGDGSSVSIVASGPGALTGTSTTSVTAVKGVATFGNLTLDTAGGYTLQASDTTDSLTSAASNSFTISPAAATQLVFSTEPIDGIASTPLAPVVLSIEDQFGNVESGDSSAVALSIASGPFNGVFTDTSTTSVNAIEGVATFSNLTLDTVGNYALAAADATDSLSSATSNRFSITAPTATVSGQLVFVQQPTNVIAGSTINPAVMVQIEDGQGNVLTADNSQVTIAIATGPAGAVLGGTVTVQAQNGVATFTDLSLTQSGSYTFTASDATDGFVSAASSSITVTPAAATQLAFLQQPTSATAGSAITPGVTVAVEDPYGNIVTDQNSTVSLFVDGAQGPWRARHRVRFTAQVQDGVATFSDLSLRRAGTYSLVAADGRLTRAISSSFVISPAAATHLFFRRVPWFTSQGQTFIVQVVLLDQYGNVATNDTSQVTLSLGMHPASAVLSGTQSVAVVNGVATFNDLSLSAPGLYTLVATDSNAALTATSVRFCIASDNQRVAALRHGYGRCPILTSL